MKIVPGELFDIEYREGETAKVKALTLREKISVCGLLKELEETAPRDGYAVLIKAVEFCLADESKDVLDKIDEYDGFEIVTKTIDLVRVNEEELKKSESPR